MMAVPKRWYYIAIVGSRNFPNRELVKWVITDYFDPDRHVLVSGQGGTVDLAAEEAAKLQSIPYLIFPANWRKGKGAGFERNSYIVDAADELWAFWDGESRGTLDSLRKASNRGIPIRLWCPDLQAEEIAKRLQHGGVRLDLIYLTHSSRPLQILTGNPLPDA